MVDPMGQVLAEIHFLMSSFVGQCQLVQKTKDMNSPTATQPLFAVSTQGGSTMHSPLLPKSKEAENDG